MDPAKGFQADMIRLENGIVPISGTALGLLVGLTLMLEATMAVPMAAAAYGLGTRSHGFNGLWGLGHSWPSVLGCWAPLTILWAVLLLIMPMLFFEGSLTEAWGQMLKEQTAPPPAGAISSDGHDDGLGWTHPGILVLLLLSLLGIVATPLWAATCVIFFRTKLGDDEMEETQQVAANKERQVERQDNRRETIRSLRQQRMPSRWKT
ncbi:MAG: hypothetical protein AB8B51_19585 [Sedimentitalea sp.]